MLFFWLILKSVTESVPIENQYKKPERGEFGPLSNRSRRTVEYLMRILSYQTLSSRDLVCLKSEKGKICAFE
jgi:hypothetical protein